MQSNALIIISISLLLEIYVYQAFKNLTDKSIFKIIYWIITISVYGITIFLINNFDKTANELKIINLLTAIFMLFILPKIFIIFFLIIDDLVRFFSFVMGKLGENNTQPYPERRKFLSYVGIGIFAIFSSLVLDGILFGKYRHTVRRVKIKIPGLPNSFKGYKIIQFSDLHSGSFKNPEKLRPAFELMNQQNADLVLFTGDAVNIYADELKPFQNLLKLIKAKDGKFSVLGNHDYTSYGIWDSEEDKAENTPKIIKIFENAQFRTLKNEHIYIEKNGERIYILGVENWGLPPFPQLGDLDKTLEGIPKDATKILMSHDPTHFDEVVKKHNIPVHLTLSGHTHGMQFGLDLKNFRWSPVKYKYPKWADLYESMGKYLYVNRGFGVIGFPGRVGILPEITLFILE